MIFRDENSFKNKEFFESESLQDISQKYNLTYYSKNVHISKEIVKYC